MSRIVFALMWLLHFLPAKAIARTGSAVGAALFWLVPERRRVVRVNLGKCFPDMPPGARERLARAHFRAFGRGFVERAILWWAPRERIVELVRLEGLEHLRALEGAPAILFAPHFVGLDAALLRLSMEFPVASIYARQKDPRFDALMYRGRARFGGRMYPRHAGLRKPLRDLKSGALLYYLPDLDYGPRGALFVPFFGVPAATVTGLAGIARAARARVLPCVTRLLPGGGYLARIEPPWTGFPSGDDAADARRMLAFVEERVLEMPEQYYWLHKRFKTRPPGEARFY